MTLNITTTEIMIFTNLHLIPSYKKYSEFTINNMAQSAKLCCWCRCWWMAPNSKLILPQWSPRQQRCTGLVIQHLVNDDTHTHIHTATMKTQQWKKSLILFCLQNCLMKTSIAIVVFDFIYRFGQADRVRLIEFLGWVGH